MRTLNFSAIGIAALLGLSQQAAASAAGTDPGPRAEATDTLEEIVVTAQKRSEAVQTVPVSMTVLPSEELTRQGVQTIQDLEHLSASLNFTGSGVVGGGGFIRGIGTETVGGDTATSSVSVVLDGVVLGNTNITDIFDIDRVEILKGPQGTLFGSSVSAGVVSLTTVAPDPAKMSATISAEYGSGSLGSEFDRRQLRATANLPLSDTSALRISFHSDDTSGVYHNPYENVDSDIPDIGFRVRYLAQPTENFKINVIGDYNRAFSTNAQGLTYRSIPAGNPFAAALASCGVTASTDNFDFCSQFNDQSLQLDRGASVQMDWNLGQATLTSITSLRLGATEARGDLESIPIATAQQYLSPPSCYFVNCVPIYAILSGGPTQLTVQHRRQYSEELRLASNGNSKLDWVAGLYFQQYDLKDSEPGFFDAIFTGSQLLDTSWSASTKMTDYAAFGNVTYHLGPSTQLIAGARVTHSKVYEAKNDPSQSGTNNTYSIDVSATKLPWRVGIQQSIAQHSMLYATVSTGFKAQEISDTLVANPVGSNATTGGMVVVAPEIPTNYELGIKTSILDNRLAIDADVFYEHVQDYQGQVCQPGTGVNSGVIVCVAANVPRVISKGLELEVFGRPVAGLVLNVSGIYNPSSYPHGYLDPNGRDLGGQQLDFAPKTKVTFSAEETVPVGANYSLVLGMDDIYRSAETEYLADGPQYIAPATNTYNARIGLTKGEHYSLYLFGRNLSSARQPHVIYPTPFVTGGLWQFYDQSSLRLVGLQFQAKF